MNEKILVAYASVHGSTKEVAEALVDALRQHNLAVDLRPLREVKSLEGYRAVVMGAPLYMFRWHKDAIGFLNRHRRALSQEANPIPVAVFALGPFNDKEDEWQEVRKELDSELAKFAWFKPASVEVFGGKFDPDHLRLPWKLLPALRNMPPSDNRDWTTIRSWADSLSVANFF